MYNFKIAALVEYTKSVIVTILLQPMQKSDTDTEL